MTPRLPLKDLKRRALLLGGLFFAVLGGMGGHQLIQRETGREVLLDAEPVDPRSLFRGYYVIIRTPLHELDVGRLAGGDSFAEGAPIFVHLTQDEAGDWSPLAVSHTRSGGAREGAGVTLEGRVTRVTPAYQTTGPGDEVGPFVSVAYNLESYFADGARAKALEESVRNGELRIIVSVTRSGAAVMKGLEIDGERYYDRLL